MSDQTQIVFDKVSTTECPSCKAQMDVSSFEAFDKVSCPSCGAEVIVPGRLGAYRLLNCLGSGGMGSVYRAYDETLARVVAIKVMLRSLGEKTEFLESFRREAQAAAKLNHPNIAQIYSFGEEKGQPYIVMELVGGRHFDEMIAAPEPLDQALVMKIGMDIADGLQLAAASNLVHGDIKPENIILDERNSAKLLDFGIASSPDAQSTEIWGTPYYIAPEKLRRQRADFRSDIYCLGGTLYHALTKHPPFEGEDAMAVVKARLEHPPEPMSKWRPDIDPEVSEIIDRMLQLEPAMRYPTYGSLLSDMRRYLARVQPKAPSVAGASTKRIVIKGRGRGAGSRTEGQDATRTQQTGSKHHISVSRGMVDSRTITSRHASQRLEELTSGNLPAADSGGSEPEKKKSGTGKKVLMGCLIAFGAVLLLTALAVGGVIYHVRSEFQKAVGDYSSKVEARNTKLAQFKTLRANSERLRDETVAAYSTEAYLMVSQALVAVEAEFGDEWKDLIIFEAQEEELGSNGDAAAGSEDGGMELDEDDGAAADAKDAEKTAAKTADAAAEDAAVDGGDTDGGNGKAVAEGGDGATDDAQNSAPEVKLEGLPAQARGVFLALAPVRAAARMVESSAEKVGEAASAAEEMARAIADQPPEKRGEVEAATLAAMTVLAAMDAGYASAAESYNEAVSAVNSLQGDVRKARDLLGTLLGEASKLAAERTRQAEEERKRKEAEEAERKRREEAERIAMAKKAEIAKIAMCAGTNLENVKAFRTDKAIRELKKLEEEMTYPETRKALAAAIKRVECVAGLKAFLVERCGAIPFEDPGGAWSVKSANERSLEVVFKNGNKEKNIQWSQVGLKQMIPLVTFYLDREDNAKSLRLRTRVDALRDAAAYYLTVDPTSEKARETATRYLAEVVERLPQRKKEVDELFPELRENAGDFQE